MQFEAYAKVNFTLEVMGKRPDGYHRLSSVVMPISLCDTLSVEESETLSSDSPYPDDLALRAAKALAPERGAAIHYLEKRIPAGGGLGGGSADAAATLIALNQLWHLGKSTAELAAIGSEVGSDVPALVYAQGGMPVLMEGRGEIVRPLSVLARPLDLVLVNPGIASSTAEVYRHCHARTGEGGVDSASMIAALECGAVEVIAAVLINDLQTPAMDLHPEIGTALAALAEAGGLGATMTGSGASVFALARSSVEAQSVAAALQSRGFTAWALRT